MKIDYTITPAEQRDEIESLRLKEGWQCVYRTGYDPTGEDVHPKSYLHVWRKQ